MFSDGIPDEGNPEGFSFGKHRLKSILQHHEQVSLAELTSKVRSAIQLWREEAIQRDDQTLIALEV